MKSVHAAMILGIGSLCLATSLFSAPINGVLFGIAPVTFAVRGGFKGLTISAPPCPPLPSADANSKGLAREAGLSPPTDRVRRTKAEKLLRFRNSGLRITIVIQSFTACRPAARTP